MKNKIQLAARFILGSIYFVFGGMGLAMAIGLTTMPEPQGMPEAAMGFMSGMMGAGYFFPVLKLTETLGGLCLLTGVIAPAALIILAPVTLQIILFHGFFTPTAGEMALPAAMGILHIVAISGYWELYKPLFTKKRT